MRNVIVLASLALIGCAGDGQPGATGPAGPAGPKGAMGDKGDPGNAGLMGATGSTGAMGNNGLSVTAMSLAAGDPNCPAGGSQFTAGLVTTYACNGAAGTKGDKGDKGDTGAAGPNVVNGSTTFTNNAIPASAINTTGLNADRVDGRHAAGGTNDSSADLIAYIEKRVCEAKGGFWSDSSGCLPFMRQTTATVAASARHATCTSEFTADYLPCNAFQALALSQSFPISQQQFYWLTGGGTSAQDSLGVIARTLAQSPSTPRCPAGTTISFFHSWDLNHVDSLECVADATVQRVLCCRRNFN